LSSPLRPLSSAGARRANLVLITCHDLGRHLGCYGVPGGLSPNLDRFAAEGTLFERAFATAPQCSPSRASLATGRYPHENGVMGLAHGSFGWNLRRDEQHIARILSAYAYETHLFGVQHVVTTGVERLGFAAVHDRRLAHEVADDVAAVLTAGARTAPLYLEINIEQPHRPYDQGGARPDHRGISDSRPLWLPDTAATYEELAALHGAIRAADEGIGQILSTLDAIGERDDTLVVVTADHGLAMPGAKCTLYDPGIEVALMLRWPGRVARSAGVAEMVSNLDLLPTLLEALDVPVPARVSGRSFWPLANGAGGRGRPDVYAEKTFHSYYDPMRAIRTDRFKLIRNFETALPVEVPADVQIGAIFRATVERWTQGMRPDLELYDLETDPTETRNLAGDRRYGDVRDELEGRLFSWMEATGDPLLEGPVVSPAYARSIRQCQAFTA
jgi:N-sulfoglucosamine sulfohydrolase